MKNSVFHKILKVKNRSSKLSIVQNMMENYSNDKKAFLIGNNWCQLCVKETGFLLGLKPSGKSLKKKEHTSNAIPEFFKEIAEGAKISPQALLKKSNLTRIIEKMSVTDDNKDSVRKLIYFYLLNSILLPTSSTSANPRYFSYIDEIEEVNWPKVIHRRMVHDILNYQFRIQIEKLKEYPENSDSDGDGEDEGKVEGDDHGEEEEDGEMEDEAKAVVTGFVEPPRKDVKKEKKMRGQELHLKFFPLLLEAFSYHRKFSIDESIKGDSNVAPVEFCKSIPKSSTTVDGKSKCSDCRDAEKSLAEQAELEAVIGRKFSLSYEPQIMKVHQSLGLLFSGIELCVMS